MKRNRDLKRRESGTLPPDKLQEILSRIYTEETVNELMSKLKGKKFRATQIGTDSRPSMGFITKDGTTKASPLAEHADPREKKLWNLELVD